jgi:hypothetical protein
MSLQFVDLTVRPPRSPRVRLGGYVILPRLLDKCRATLAGKNGEYHYACPQDQRFFMFVGIAAEDLKAEVAKGKGDGELLAWINAHATTPRTDADVAAWSALQESRGPTLPDSRDYFNGEHRRVAPERDDIATWFDLLDLDDFASFGGQP